MNYKTFEKIKNESEVKMAEIIKPINYREIARIQMAKIKSLENKIEDLKAMLTILFITMILSIVATVYVFIDVQKHPEKLLPAGWVEVVEVPELEEVLLK